MITGVHSAHDDRRRNIGASFIFHYPPMIKRREDWERAVSGIRNPRIDSVLFDRVPRCSEAKEAPS